MKKSYIAARHWFVMKRLRSIFIIVLSFTLIMCSCSPKDKDNNSNNSSFAQASSFNESIIASSDFSSNGSEGISSSSTSNNPSSPIIGADTMLKTIDAYSPNISKYTFEKGFSDYLDLGSESSRTAHKMTVSSSVKEKTVSYKNGTVKKSSKAMCFSGKQARADFYLNLSSPVSSGSEPMMLEIMEIHNSNYLAFGYQVFVNDTEVYFRTYEEIASGQITYFVPFQKNLVKNAKQVKISIVSAGDSPFHIGKIWAYSNFYELMQKEQVLTKMGINLYCNNDLIKASNFRKEFSGYRSFEAGALFGEAYMNKLADAGTADLSSYAASGGITNSNIQIMLARYWSYTPYGADGKGGNWSDLKYQSALYNPSDGAFYPTTPNMWSNTFWPSMYNKHLNSVSNLKIGQMVSGLSTKLAFLAASGQTPKKVEMIMEWGTGYYHQSDFYGGDFGTDVLNEAKKRGITLDPKDGLSFQEKKFLYDIVAEYNQEMADTYRRAMGYDAVAVRDGNITLPTYQTIDNIYSHGTQTADQYISYDNRVAGWMSGIGNGYWPSSENMYWDTQRFYDYQMGYGRIACVNLEMAIHNPKKVLQDYVKRCYQNGMSYVTLFNDEAKYGTAANLREIDDLQNKQAYLPEHYEPAILDVDYMRDFSPNMITSKGAGVVSYKDCKVGKTGNLYPTSSTTTGIVTYVVSNNQKPFENGIKLYLEGSEYGDIEIFGGTDLNNLSKVGTFQYHTREDWFNAYSADTIDLTSRTKGATQYYIQLRLKASSIRAVKALMLWNESTGSKQNITTTFSQARLQSMWVQQRAVTERLLKDYSERCRKGDKVYSAAQKLYDAGRYKSAYQLLTGEISQLLPAKYAIQGKGQLGRYPINVNVVEGEVAVVQLNTVSAKEISFSVQMQDSGKINMTVNALGAGNYYTIEKTSETDYRIFSTSSKTKNAVAVKNNKVSFDIDVSKKAEKKFVNQKITGSSVFGMGESYIDLQVQDPSVGEYAISTRFYVYNDCVYTRRSEDSSKTSYGTPRAGDMVTVTLDNDGFVVKMESVYGKVTGKVKSFTRPSVYGTVSNGVIQLDNGVKYEIAYAQGYTEFKTSRLKGYSRALSITDIGNGIKVGDKITISYCPYTYKGSLRRILSITD